jgi:hypothetical protein
MSRSSVWTFCLGMLGFGAGASLLTAEPISSGGLQKIPDYTGTEMKAISSRNQQFKEQLAAQQHFQERLRQGVDELLEHRDLRRATAEVCGAALDHHPQYLTHIRWVESGSTDRERAAHNLIKSVVFYHQKNYDARATVESIQQFQAEVHSPDFLQWCAENQSPGAATETP